MKKIMFLTLFIGFLSGLNAQETFQSLYKQGNKEVDIQNYQKALEYLDKALQLGCDDKSKISWTATICGICALQLNNETKAMEYNKIAIINGSTDATLIDQQLDLAKKHKDNKTIKETLLAGRNIEGYYGKYTIKLLYFYYNNKLYNETIVTANEVLEFKPEHTNSKYFKAIAFLKTGKEDEAIPLFKELLSKNPENAKANTQLGLLWYNKASAIFDNVNLHYKSLKKPTRLDYHNYRKAIRNSIPGYKKCIPLLEKAYELKQQKYIKEALTLAQSRLRQAQQD